MIRLVVYILLSLAITAAAAWVISVPGTVAIEVAGYRMQPRFGLFVLALIVLVLLCLLLWAIIRRILGAPRALSRYSRRRRRQQGYEALADAYIALEAGNPVRARQLARDAQSRLRASPAALLLEARADLALGDLGAARENYKALIGDRRTALAALSGLYEQAQAQGRSQAALTFAQWGTPPEGPPFPSMLVSKHIPSAKRTLICGIDKG